MARARLILADDHEMLIDGLRKILEPEFDLVATPADGRAALAAFEQLRPDLLILDISLPLLNGIEVARHVKSMAPSARILFVTLQTDRVYIEEAFRAGGSGYVLKQAAASELVEAIRAVLKGRFYVSSLVAARTGISPRISATDPTDHFGGRLTARQREVMQLLAEGKSMKEAAEILQISVRTVEFHKNGIMQELGLHSTAELIRYAIENGITGGPTA